MQHGPLSFIKNMGNRLLPDEEKNVLLRKYWSIPDRQIETSVVLANKEFNQSAY